MLMFTYGTLMSGFGNNYLLSGDDGRRGMLKPSKLIGPAVTIKRFKMYGYGFPYIREDEDGYPVLGELWDIGDVENDKDAAKVLKTLDMLESVNHDNPANGFYARVRANVKVRNETYNANLYQATAATWQRAIRSEPVKPDEQGLLNWRKRHMQR